MIEHPIPNLIAYHDSKHIPVKKNRSFEELIKPAEELILLKDYLENPNDWQTLELELIGNDALSLKITSVDNDRLLILDTDNDQLFQYNIKDNNSELVAKFGRGPGELQLSSDISRAGEHVYVSRLDMRLSRFKCGSEGCGYDKTIILDVQPISIASTPKGLSMATVAIINGGENLVRDSAVDFPAVKIIDYENGQIIEEFGKIYSTKYMMVMERFSRNGLVEYIPELDKYVYASSWFPYLYIYNAHFELEESYKLEKHSQNHFEFYPAEQRRRFPVNDHTIITNLKVLKGGQILIITTTQDKRYEEEGEIINDYAIDYYVIDHSNRIAVHLGTERKTSFDQSLVFPFKNTMIKNDGGVLYRLIKK